MCYDVHYAINVNFKNESQHFAGRIIRHIRSLFGIAQVAENGLLLKLKNRPFMIGFCACFDIISPRYVVL